ncbi:hypothetical protein SAMN05428949_0306 [Chitinophaga sp. YR627]|nr:hypothetical protein SAMN05428949_0306 [Chitinophaga sp. YR627]
MLVVSLCNCRTTQSFHQTAANPPVTLDTIRRIISYGWIPVDTSVFVRESQLAKDWGFYLLNINEPASRDSIVILNKTADRQLTRKHGKNWKRKFDQELMILTATPARMQTALLVSDLDYFHLMGLLHSKGDTLFSYFEPTSRRGVYHAKLLGWSRKDTLKEWGSFARYIIDNSKIDPEVTGREFIPEAYGANAPLYYLDSLFKIQQR